MRTSRWNIAFLTALATVTLTLSAPVSAQKPDKAKIRKCEQKLEACTQSFQAALDALRTRYHNIEEATRETRDPAATRLAIADLERVLEPVLASVRQQEGSAASAVKKQLGSPLDEAVAKVEVRFLKILGPGLGGMVRDVFSESNNPADALGLSDREIAERALDPLLSGAKSFHELWNATLKEHMPELSPYTQAHQELETAKDDLAIARDPLLRWTKGAPPGFARVPAGTYAIQNTAGFHAGRRPARRVSLEADVFIGLREVTVGEYLQWLNAFTEKSQRDEHLPRDRSGKPLWELDEDTGLETPKKDRMDHPVTHVTLRSALLYAAAQSARLPQEAEWCAMAGGPKNFNYPWGNEFIPDVSNCRQSGLNDTKAVGSYSGGRGPFGHYDIAGNAAEWTMSYENGKPIDVTNLSHDLNAVVRGGSFRESPENVTNGWIWLKQSNNDRDAATGFRLAISAK